MSFLNLGERKTAVEWRLEEEGMMSWFKDEYDEIPITHGEWRSGLYRPQTNTTQASPVDADKSENSTNNRRK